MIGEEVRIRVVIELPSMKEPFVAEIHYNTREAGRMGFVPLPRGHDDPLDIWSHKVAEGILADRTKAMGEILNQIGRMFRLAFNRIDPDRGYFPGERNA